MAGKFLYRTFSHGFLLYKVNYLKTFVAFDINSMISKRFNVSIYKKKDNGSGILNSSNRVALYAINVASHS